MDDPGTAYPLSHPVDGAARMRRLLLYGPTCACAREESGETLVDFYGDARMVNACRSPY
ncbi:hypothetical protein HY634_01830 [Candidatus Uhrbacteria bacterium]|nr:hypothetical protein [Candidatus Uhrbacteria bacterium]